MKKINRLALVLFLTGSAAVASPDSTYGVDGNHLIVSRNGQSRICKLDQLPRFAVESFDRSAVIVSETGFVSVLSPDSCTSAQSVHVSSIPKGTGVLADINLSQQLYIALDFVSVRPFLYLATVGRIGSPRNLVTLHGANVPGSKLSIQQKYAFGGSGDAGSATISPDGRFVAPSGELRCRDDAYPGVWDISRNKHVVMDDESCERLFSFP